MTHNMKYRITQLTRTNTGTYHDSGNILPDMLNGAPCPNSMDDMLAWLSDLGYQPAHGYAGWGTVVQHQETGELLSFREDPEYDDEDQ